MAKKKDIIFKEGAPGWMVTFGDMMSLILCFFVMLFSLSELKADKMFEAVESMKGYHEIYSPVDSKQAFTDLTSTGQIKLQTLQPKFGPHKERGATPVAHPFGPDALVENIRGGMRLVLGGKAGFAEDSVAVTPEMKETIAKVAARIRGEALRVEVRGHATPAPSEAWPDKWDLSWARARATADVLIAAGLDPRRIRISGLAQYDPVEPNLAKDGPKWNNRVEIVVLPEVVKDLLKTGPDE